MVQKQILSILSLIVVLSPAMSFAEGDGSNQDWAEKAALQYEEKAAKSQATGNTKDAVIYTKMAQIKRDAGAAAKEGKPFSWDEYHALHAQLIGSDKHSGDTAKDAKGKDEPGDQKAKDTDKNKSHVGKDQVKTKDKEDPANGFINAAQQYQKQSIEAIKSGDTEKAKIYMELAQMKLDAATAVRQGKDYDWTRYHELVKSLEK